MEKKILYYIQTSNLSTIKPYSLIIGLFFIFNVIIDVFFTMSVID